MFTKEEAYMSLVAIQYWRQIQFCLLKITSIKEFTKKMKLIYSGKSLEIYDQVDESVLCLRVLKHFVQNLLHGFDKLLAVLTFQCLFCAGFN